MQTVSFHSLLRICTLVAFTFNTQQSLSHAATNDEAEINKIFETYGKENVVKVITQKRNGKITIQKNKSFLTAYGKPDLNFVTVKTIIQDLGNLTMDIDALQKELDAHMEREAKKEREVRSHKPITNVNVNNLIVGDLNCKEDLYEYPDKHNYAFALHFANCWNGINGQLTELKESCVKPDITGWTRDPAALEWANCISRNTNENNRLVREIKSLMSIKSMISNDLSKFNIYTELPAYLE